MNCRTSFRLADLPALYAFWTLASLLLVATADAEPVTLERVEALPAAEQAPWRRYLERSQARARADADALAAEIDASGLSAALRAPSGGDFKLSAKAGDPWYAGDEAGRLADVILSYQTPSGGWSKHTGYSRGPRQAGMQWTSQNEPGRSPHYVATFDNRSTTEQLQFLANVWLATQRDDCREAIRRGLDFVFEAQYPHGGWPQVYPLEGGYHDDVTLNDDVLVHVLELLHAVAQGEERFACVDAARRDQAVVAFEAGVARAIRLQVERDGKPTGWCAQYDALTLEPSQARALEPPTLSGAESAQLLKFLMTVPRPSAELVQAIDAGLAWLDEAKVVGLMRGKRDGKTVYEPAPDSAEVYWARFYDLQTGKPVFPGRDGVLYDSFAAMAANNALGYDYFSTRPGSVLNNGQKKWRKMLAKEEPGGTAP
ncbi:MAG: pectate lyase [Pirellulales bacterium]|nr:pectate lyase [Pirellulales bacterium]